MLAFQNLDKKMVAVGIMHNHASITNLYITSVRGKDHVNRNQKTKHQTLVKGTVRWCLSAFKKVHFFYSLHIKMV